MAKYLTRQRKRLLEYLSEHTDEQIPHTTANAPNDKFRPQKTTGTLTGPVAFLRFIKRNLPLF